MNRNFVLLVTLLFTVSFSFAQKNKYQEIISSKKLSANYRGIKDKDKEDFYQQYYWLVKMEQLKSYPHLQGIKPVVLYEFIKEINPINPVKEMSPEQKKLRNDAEHALNVTFGKRDLQNPNLIYNLESYVDPAGSRYYTNIDAEKVKILVPKRLYYFESFNSKYKITKKYYLWVNDDKHKIISLVPNEKTDKKFYSTLKTYMPKYTFNEYVPAVKPGKKNDKKDADFFYIIPFQEGYDNIEYRTDDFKTFELIRYKKDGEPWTDVIYKKKQN